MLRYPDTAPMLRGRTHPLLTLTMLSPSSPSSSAACESRLPSFLRSSSPNPKTSLPYLPPPLFSNSQDSPQRMMLSRCCSGVSSPVPISGIPEMENSEPEFDDPQSLVVVSFYKFADFPDHAHLRKPLKELCEALIVTLGMPTVSPIERVGKYVGPRDWNALISDPDTRLEISEMASLALKLRVQSTDVKAAAM